MPFHHRIDANRQLITVTAQGQLDIEQCRQAIADVADDPGFRSQYRTLVDLRSIHYVSSTGDIHSLVNSLARVKHLFTERVAVVVSGKFIFGLARMAEILADNSGFKMRAFEQLSAARHWLESD